MAGLVGTVTASTTPTHVISDQTWTAAGNPYLIDDMLVIMPDKTLTIEEGVVIEFSPSGSLDVRGDLNVFGTAADPVVFTIDSANATSTSQWGGIQLQTDDFDVDLVMRNAVVSRADTGVRIACCHQGSILIEDSTFLENGVAISGYAGYDAIINNVTFMYNTAGVDSADKDITHSTFMHNMWGIRSAERVDVSYSLFEDNDVAAYGGRGLLHCNVIQENRIGVLAFYEGWALEDNLIQDNYEVGVINGPIGSVPHAWGNSFLNNGMGANTVADISVQHTLNFNIDFGQNWWGTTNSSVIDAAIHDFFDDSQLGIVDYTPMLTADSTTASCQGGGPGGPGDEEPWDVHPWDDDNETIDLNGTDPDDDGTGITPDTNGTEPDDDGTGITPDTNETEPLDNDTGTEDPHANGTDPSTNGTDPIGDDEEPCHEHPWEDDDDWSEFDDAWKELMEEYDERLSDIEERESEAFEALSEECNEAWAELFENFNEEYDELQEQLEESLDELEENYQSDLETSYAVYQHEYDELLELLDNTTTEEEYDAVVQQMVDLLLQETSSIESLNDYYELWSEQIHNESEAAMDELYDQLDADAAAVDEECHEAMEHLEEQFSQEYEDLDDWYQEQAELLDARMLELVGEDADEPADERHPDEEDVDDTSSTSDMESGDGFGIGDTVPGFTGVLSVAAMSGAVLLVGRRRLL